MAQPNELPEKFPCWCRAKYSWGGQTKKDLGFIEGDLIECLNAGDGSWWMGRLKRDKRQIGLFPSNFVVLLEGDQALTGRSEGSLPDTQKSLDKKGTRSSYQAVEKESSDSRWKQSPMPPAMKQGDTDNISPAPIPPPHRHSISDTSRRMLMAMSPHLPQASTASEAPDLVSSKNPWAKFATQSTSDPNPDTLTQPVNFGSKAGRRHSLGIEETNSANTTKLPVAIRDFGDTPSKLASGRPENDIQDDLEIVYSGFTTSTRATSGAYSIATASSAQSSITNSSVFSSLSSASTDKSSVASSSSLARKGIEPKKANPFRSAFFENLIRNSKEKRAAKAPTFAHWKESNSEQASASTLAGYDWVSVRRDVNRSSTPGPADQEERILQTRSLDEPHMYPVEELYESQTNGESRDGSHVQDPFKLIDNFDLIDERVKHFVSLPSRITAAVLATSFLCRPYKSEISKIRAIFVWCSSQLHWQQDEDTVSHHSKQADTSLVIQQREGTSRGIAAVVQDMCNAVGVVVEMIEGQFKTPAEGHIMMHWWNAVLIHNEWRFMDACLAQPNFIKSSTLIEKASKLEFFLTIPVELCWTHVPADHCQQHLLPCVSTTLLLALPSAYPAFFQLGLSLHKYNLSMIKLRGLEMCVVNLNVPEDIEIVAEVKVAGQIQGGIDSSTVNTELLQALALAQPKWYRIGHNVRLKRYTIKAALPSGVTSGSLKIYAGKRGLTHSRKGNVRPLALIVPISHLGSENPEFKFCRRHATPHATRNDLYLSQPQCLYLLRNCTYVFQVLQHAATVPSDDDSEGNKERPAKMAIQSPSGKIIRLLRNTNSVPSQTSKEKDLESEVLGTSYETVIKVGETGIWRGLVLADRSARWCVWAEWQCIDGLKRHDNHDPHTEALTANESRQTDAESVVIESGLGKPPLRSGDVLSEESVSPTRNDEELAKERFKIPRSELENVLKLHAESINHDKVVANHPLQAGTAAIRTPSVIAESVEEVGDSDATGSFKNPWDPDSFEKLVHFTSAPKEKETGKDLPQLPLSPIDSIETLIKTIEDDLLREDKASHRSDTLSHVGDAHDTAEIQQSHPTESKTLDMDPPQSLVAVSPDQPIDLSCKDSNFFELKDSSSAQAHLVQTDPSRTARSEQSQIAIDFSEFGSQKSLGDEHVHVTPSDDFSKGLETEDSISNDDEMVAKSEADFREDSTRPGVEEGPVAQLNPLRLDDEGRSYQGIWYWAVDAVKSNCTSVAALFGWSLFTTRETNKVAITWTCVSPDSPLSFFPIGKSHIYLYRRS